jgi:hypothetical protein
MKHTGAAFSYVAIAAMFVVMICISLMSLSCTNDAVIDPMNPNIKPEIISTYPVNGSTGPFENIYPNGAHFYIHFNKLMDRSSFTNKTIRCEGPGYPVYVSVYYADLYSNSRYGDIIGFEIQRYSSGLHYLSDVKFDVNTPYTITVDSTVRDFNGNQLGYQFRFAFRPEPYFRPTAISFREGDTLRYYYQDITFNNKINIQTLRTIRFEPSLSISNLEIFGPDSNYAQFMFASLVPLTHYTMTIGIDCQDAYGNPVYQAIQRSFYTKPFRLEGMYPSGNISLVSNIGIGFTYPIDTSTARNAFSITPLFSGSVEITSEGYTLIPTNDFPPSTNYSIVISNALKNTSGVNLDRPIQLSFSTVSFSVSESHWDDESHHTRTPKFLFSFTGRIDTSTFRGALSITPSIEGTLAYVGSTSPYGVVGVEFVPNNYLLPFATYTFTLANTVKSIAGYGLANSLSFTYTTEDTKR